MIRISCGCPVDPVCSVRNTLADTAECFWELDRYVVKIRSACRRDGLS